MDATNISYWMLFCLQRLEEWRCKAAGSRVLTDYESALEFRELSDFKNVPIIHGRYEADQKCCSSPNTLGPGS